MEVTQYWEKRHALYYTYTVIYNYGHGIAIISIGIAI